MIDWFKTFFSRDTKTWRKVTVQVHATTPVEFLCGAWWVSETIWNSTAAPMYFARYSTPGNPVLRIELRVDLCWTKEEFQKFLTESGEAPIACEVIDVEPCEGSIQHAQAWALAHALRGKNESSITETLHWFFNMCGYSYLTEARVASEHAAQIIRLCELNE